MRGFLPVWSPSGTKLAFIMTDETEATSEHRYKKSRTLFDSYLGTEVDTNTYTYKTTVKNSIFTLTTYDISNGSVCELYQINTNTLSPGKLGWLSDDRITIVLDSTQGSGANNSYAGSKNCGWIVKDIDCSNRTASDVMFIPKDLEKMQIFCLSPNCQKLLLQRGEATWLADLENNTLDKVLEAALDKPTWGMNGKSFYYSMNGKVWHFNIETKKCISITEVKSYPSQISSDDLKIVFAMPTPTNDEDADAQAPLTRIYVVKIK